ncbi:hypothetical protein GKJ95_23820, partial [Escherichia coli]|nr:hypothetical protein [Escherichia coli]
MPNHDRFECQTAIDSDAILQSRSKGRKNQRSTRTHCHHPSPKIYSASAKEPW